MVLDELAELFGKSMTGGQVARHAFQTVDEGAVRLAQLRRRLDQRVQHGLQVEGRAADDLEHVGGGGLLLQRLAQLVDQPYVLDRDHRLVGEGLEQGDLPLAEEASLGTAEHDRADRDTFSHQGDAEDRAVALTPRVLARVGKFVPLGLYISDVDGPPVQHRSTTNRAADEWDEGLGTGLRDRAVMGDKK